MCIRDSSHTKAKSQIPNRFVAFFYIRALQFSAGTGRVKIATRYLQEITTDKEAKITDVWHSPCPYEK